MNRILVVEDNRELRTLVSEHLHRAFGWEIVEAANSVQARAVARSGPIALTILDLILEGVSPVQLAAELRAYQGNPDMPIILISGFHPDELIGSLHAFAARFNRDVDEIRAAAYLVKPFSLEELRWTVAKVLELAHGDGRHSATTDTDRDAPDVSPPFFQVPCASQPK